MKQEVLRQLSELHRRFRRVQAIDSCLELAFVLTTGVAAMLLIDRLAFELGLAPLHVTSRLWIAVLFGGALAAAIVSGLVASAARSITSAAIAWRADRALALDERFLTSVELATDGDGSRFAPALYVQAAEAMKGVDVRTVFPRAAVGYRWGVALAIGAGIVLAAFAPRVDAVPVADFAFTPDRGTAPLVVSFNDGSQGRISGYDWDFGDGTVSVDASPTHRFVRPGRYTVRLIVRGPGGHNEKSALVEAIDPSQPVADFEADPARGRAPLEVRFTNRSHRAETCAWAFGDGATSVERGPIHVFEKPGSFDVVLEASNAMGRSFKSRRVKVLGPNAPMADFRAMPRKGPGPLTVDFEDMSTGAIDSWEWDTGDFLAGKERIRRTRMLSHEYTLPGKYTVRLKVVGPGGEDEIVRERYIEVENEGQGAGGSVGGAGAGVKGGGGGSGAGGGGGAGGREGQVFGDEATRPKAEYTPESVTTPGRSDEMFEKIKSVYSGDGSGQPGQEKPYDTKTFGEYRQAAEDSMNKERIPVTLRSYVKQYFEEIRPK